MNIEREHTLKKYYRWLFAFLGGLFYASGFPLFSDFTFLPGAFLGLTLFFYILLSQKNNSTLKNDLMLAWFFSAGAFILGYYWIPQTLKEFGDIPSPFHYIIGCLFTFFCLPQIYLITIAFRKIKHPLYIALLYALFEYYTPQQFPAHLGHTLLPIHGLIPLKLSPIFGSMIYSFVMLLFSFVTISFIQKKKSHIFSMIIILVCILAHFLLPNNFKQTKIETSLQVKIVQPNIGNYLKLNSEKGHHFSIDEVYKRFLNLSLQGKKSDLIIFPETAYPPMISSVQLFSNPESIDNLALISELIEQTGAELFTGGYDSSQSDKDSINREDSYQIDYNSAFHFSKNAKLKQVYHKMKLIPFGEGLPFGPINKYLSPYLQNITFFSEGQSAKIFKTDSGSIFTAAICYEILFPDFLRKNLNSLPEIPLFLINITNDSWYGLTSEPFQHLFLAKWRSLEFNLPIIRSTNTGISTIFYPDGREDERINSGLESIKDYELKLIKREKTLFEKYGPSLFLLLAFILILLEKIPLLKDREDV